MHEYLRQHPQISLPRRKETHFFICDKKSTQPPLKYFGRVLENYIDNLEDYQNDFEIKPTAIIYGEVCPSYIFYPNAAENIQKYIPNVKIICILRNPVDRFYSNFNYRESKFGEAEKKTGGTQFHKFDETVESVINGTSTTDTKRNLEIGYFLQSISQIFCCLFPKNNIKVFLFEDLQRQPRKLMNDLMRFIGMPDYPFDVDMKFNVSGKLRFRWLYRKIRNSRLARFLRRTFPARIYQKTRNLAEK